MKRPWCTLLQFDHLSEEELHAACDLRLIYLGQDVYGELKSRIGTCKSLQVFDAGVAEIETSNHGHTPDADSGVTDLLCETAPQEVETNMPIIDEQQNVIAILVPSEVSSSTGQETVEPTKQCVIDSSSACKTASGSESMKACPLSTETEMLDHLPLMAPVDTKQTVTPMKGLINVREVETEGSASSEPEVQQVQNQLIPPLLPIILPLKFLVVEYLKGCSSDLVNPVVFSECDDVNDQTKLDATHSSAEIPKAVTDMKSQNIANTLDYNQYLLKTTKERNYSVVINRTS